MKHFFVVNGRRWWGALSHLRKLHDRREHRCKYSYLAFPVDSDGQPSAEGNIFLVCLVRKKTRRVISKQFVTRAELSAHRPYTEIAPERVRLRGGYLVATTTDTS